LHRRVRDNQYAGITRGYLVRGNFGAR